MQVQCASNESQALTRAIEMINWGILRKVNSTLYILRPEEICKHSQSLLVHWFGGVCLRFIDKYLFFSKQAIGKKIIIAWITFCNRTFRVGQLEQRLVTRCMMLRSGDWEDHVETFSLYLFKCFKENIEAIFLCWVFHFADSESLTSKPHIKWFMNLEHLLYFNGKKMTVMLRSKNSNLPLNPRRLAEYLKFLVILEEWAYTHWQNASLYV